MEQKAIMGDRPQFPVYNADRQLDLAATLNMVPDSLDKKYAFFRDVPEWFEAGTGNPDELRGVLDVTNNMPEEERKKFTAEDIHKMRCAM